MKSKDYCLQPLDKCDIEAVAKLQKFLWGPNIINNVQHMKWKYIDNPNTDKPLGFVVRKDDSIVGFRGFFITKWKLSNNKFFLLSTADTIVHPNHRRKGIFSALVKYTVQEFDDSNYQAHISMSANNTVTRGKLKMGWKPLVPREYMRRINLGNLFKIWINNKIGFDLSKNNIKFGIFKEIEVSNICKYNEIIKLNKLIEDKFINLIILDKDEEFYKWRFNSKRRNYVFYYYYDDRELKAYIIILMEKYRIAKIIDYAFVNSGYIHSILQFIIKKNHFNILSILEASINSELFETIKRLQFSNVDFFSHFEKAEKNLLVTIRPIKSNYGERDWFLFNKDIRSINNWMLREICSDGV